MSTKTDALARIDKVINHELNLMMSTEDKEALLEQIIETCDGYFDNLHDDNEDEPEEVDDFGEEDLPE